MEGTINWSFEDARCQIKSVANVADNKIIRNIYIARVSSCD